MRIRYPFFFHLLIWLCIAVGNASGFSASPSATIRSSELPPQARDVLALIDQRGPFPYRQDDKVFGNREKLLPQKIHGYYREYTVTTPGSRTRGARRIVTGGNPPVVFYYTDNHYRSFSIIQRTSAR